MRDVLVRFKSGSQEVLGLLMEANRINVTENGTLEVIHENDVVAVFAPDVWLSATPGPFPLTPDAT